MTAEKAQTLVDQLTDEEVLTLYHWILDHVQNQSPSAPEPESAT